MATIAVPSTELRVFSVTGLSLTGQAATIDVGVTIAVPTGALTIASTAPSAEITHSKTPTTTALAISSDNVVRLVNHIRGPPVDSLALAADAPSILVSQTPGSDSLSLSSVAVTLDYGLSATVGTLVLTGNAPQTLATSDSSPDTLAISSDAPTVTVTVILSAGDPDSLSLTGNAPSLNWSLLGQVGSISLSAAAPVLNIGNAGTSITNPNAETGPSNYEICDFTGFRQMPGSLKMTWNKYAVRRKSWEERHPQDFVRSVPERRRKGSKRPEQDDRFIGTDVDEVTQDDL